MHLQQPVSNYSLLAGSSVPQVLVLLGTKDGLLVENTVNPFHTLSCFICGERQRLSLLSVPDLPADFLGVLPVL